MPDENEDLSTPLDEAPVSAHEAAHGGEACGIAAITRPVPVKRDKPAIDPRTVALDRDDALLFVIDVQEKLCAAMDARAVEALTKNIQVLIRAAHRLGLPVIASEQYRKGLGPTLPAIAELLREPAFDKLEFSAGNNEALARAVLQTKRRQVLVVGMETHICIFQTARDLTRAGFATFVLEDAVLSRTEANRQLGLSLCERAGATRTGTEAVVFDLLGQAGTEEFRALAREFR